MKTSKIIAKNFISNVAMRTLVPFVSFAIFIAVARIMGVEAVGKYTLLFTVFMIFQYLSSMGITPLLIRMVAQKHEPLEKLYASALAIGPICIAIWAPILVAFFWLGGYASDVFTSSFFLAAALPFAYVSVINEAAFMGMENFETIPVINLIEAAYLTAGSFMVMYNGLGIVPLVAVLASSKLISAATGFVLLSRKMSVLRMEIDRELTVVIFKSLPAFLAIYGFVVLFSRVDILILSAMVPDKDLGLYSAASKLYLLALILPDSLGNSLFPRFSKFSKDGKPFEISLRAVRYAILGLTPVVLFLFIYGRQIIFLLFGNGYGTSISVLMTVIWGIFPYVTTSVLGYALLADNHHWASAKIAFTGFVFNLVLTCLLVKAYGFYGAALSVLISQFFLLMLTMYYINRHMFRAGFFSDFLFLCFPAATAGVFCALVPMVEEWQRFVLAFFIFVLLSLSLKLIRRSDLQWLRQRF